MEFDSAKALPDDDIMFKGIPAGACKQMDGIFYARESEWIPFLRIIWAARSKEPCPY